MASGFGRREIYIIGNGKSLKDFDFNFLKDKKWIGTCLGFRDWDRTGIYPTHYCCVDDTVCHCHRNKILEMIEQKKCESFLLCGSLWKSDIGDKLKEFKNVIPFQNLMFGKITNHENNLPNPFRYLVDYCSGTSASLYGYMLNYETIHLLGMDCEYVEFIPECIKLDDGTLKITETPKENPNYYFNDYQQKGDIYKPPNVEKIHCNSWQDLRNIFLLYNILRTKDILIYQHNTKENKKLDIFFEKKDINELKV